jgi:5-methylcytosine-specific restriction enzyme A
MGNLPLKQCMHPGCRELTTSDRCPEHKKKSWDESDRLRGTRTERGYSNRWLKARESYLIHHPLCKHCLEDGIKELATEVDHIIPHRGDMSIFWKHDNWQGLCTYHHRIKTAKESKHKVYKNEDDKS